MPATQAPPPSASKVSWSGPNWKTVWLLEAIMPKLRVEPAQLKAPSSTERCALPVSV